MEPEKKISGALVGLVIIIIILIVGGIYIWISNKNTTETTDYSQVQSETVTNQDSTELDTLDKDIQKTDINSGVDVNAVN